MAGRSASSNLTRYAGLQVQTSSLGVNVPVGWGTFRCKCNLVDYLDFKSKAQKASSGKGGSTTTGYSYSATVIMALCEGPIDSIDSVYINSTIYEQKGSKSALQQAGLSLSTGAIGQPVWSYLTSHHADHAIGYSGLTIAYAHNYSLGSSATSPNHSFEVVRTASFGVSGTSDADPSLVITDFFTNARYGVPSWAPGLLGDLAQYQDYCLAAGLLVSPVIDSQRSASDFVTELLRATNSTCVWSEGRLKFLPYGDKTLTGHGATYTPNLTPVYALGDDDFVVEHDTAPLTVDIEDQTDAYNVIQLEYLDRSNQYNMAIALADDAANVAQYGERRKDPDTVHCICDPSVAAISAQLYLQRTLYVRGKYKFKLGWMFAILEPGDIVELTDAGLGLSAYPVRIIQIDEDEKYGLSITAEDAQIGVAHAPLYTMQESAGTVTNQGVEPGGVEANLLLWSEDLTNVVWPALNAVVTANVATDPLYGTTTAAQLTPTTASGIHQIYQALSIFEGENYCWSIYFKPAGRKCVEIGFQYPGNTDAVYIGVDLAAGSILYGPQVNGAGSAVGGGLTDVGGGWYRVHIVGSHPSATLALAHVFVLDDSGNNTWTGDGANGVYIWGGQVKQGADLPVYSGTTTVPAGPILFNPPAALVSGQRGEVWAAVSGGADWGGCNVWTSIDGTNYQQVGTIDAHARFGVLTDALAAGGDPDTTSALTVDISQSAGALSGGSTADADASATLCLIEGELVSFETATLTAPYRYDLSGYLRRGVMGTAIAAHNARATFVRLDDAIFDFPYYATQANTPAYVKFQSFNGWGQGTQSLADCIAYPFTPTLEGSALSSSVNRIELSLFEKGVYGWSIGYNPAGLATTFSSSIYQGTPFIKLEATTTAAGQQLSIKSQAFLVTGGERLATQAGLETQGTATGDLAIFFEDASGAVVSTAHAGFPPAGTPYQTPYTGFVTAPATAVLAWLEYYGTSNGAGYFATSLTHPMVSGASAGQIGFPVFSAGPNAEAGADVTLEWTAAAIVGQAPAATDNTIASGATKNIVSVGSVTPSNPTNGDLWADSSTNPAQWKSYFGGAWVVVSTVGGAFDATLYESLGGSVATVSAFKTILGTASAITGQGALATKNTVSTSDIDPGAVASGNLASGAVRYSTIHVGLRLAQASAGQTTVAITADNVTCVDGANNSIYTGALSNTLTINATSLDGLDTGSLTASTWYYVWIISNGTQVHSLMSLSSSAPTMPGGYTYKARVGAVNVNASRHVTAYVQNGHDAQYVNTGAGNTIMANSPAGDVNAGTYVAVSVSAFVPPTATRINLIGYSDGGNTIGVAPNNNYGSRSSHTNVPPIMANQTNGTCIGELVLESANIYWYASGSYNTVSCLGWTDSF